MLRQLIYTTLDISGFGDTTFIEVEFRKSLFAHLGARHEELHATLASNNLTLEEFETMRDNSGGMISVALIILFFIGQYERLAPTRSATAVLQHVVRQTCDVNDLFSLGKDIRDNEHNVVRVLRNPNDDDLDWQSYYTAFLGAMARAQRHYIRFRDESTHLRASERGAMRVLMYGMFMWQINQGRFNSGKALLKAIATSKLEEEQRSRFSHSFQTLVLTEIGRLPEWVTTSSRHRDLARAPHSDRE